MNTIACLGWGSLIWEPQSLPLRGVWFQDGPLLPLEFARESARAGEKEVSVVLLPRAALVRSLWTLLAVKNMEEAKKELADREGLEPKEAQKHIGWWAGDHNSKHDGVEEIGAWAVGYHLDGVVWTALEPTFMKELSRTGVNAVLKHLHAMPYAHLKYNEEYFCRTPRQIDTEVRRAVEKEFHWTPVG